MRSYNRFPLTAILLVIMALCTLFTGCTSLPNILQPPAATPVPTPAGPEVEITAVATTASLVQALATEPIRKKPSDTEFLLAYNASQEKILALVTIINTELVKDTVSGNIYPDYTALGSYARKLSASADEEITEMAKYREISDPANESRKEYYVNYLTRLKPFAANLETGASLAQKKETNIASGFFSNAKNDLALVRSQELPGHLKMIAQIRENFGPFLDAVQQQGKYPAPV
jgi:hypothetical protein